MTTEIALQLMQLLLSHHELDDAISRIMKGYSIHILPSLNRDGIGLNQPGDCSSLAGSLNQAGVDLLQDFTGGHSKTPEPEAQRLMTWMDQRKFLFSINLRGSDEDIGVPNVKSPKLCHDLAQQYLSSLKSDVASTCQSSPNIKVKPKFLRLFFKILSDNTLNFFAPTDFRKRLFDAELQLESAR